MVDGVVVGVQSDGDVGVVETCLVVAQLEVADGALQVKLVVVRLQPDARVEHLGGRQEVALVEVHLRLARELLPAPTCQCVPSSLYERGKRARARAPPTWPVCARSARDRPSARLSVRASVRASSVAPRRALACV